MILPSKELLSEVLERDVCNMFCLGNTSLLIVEWNDSLGVNSEQFNIYELMHMMKEWALEQGYHLIEYVHAIDIIKREGSVNMAKIVSKIDFDVSNTFKACEWILKHLDSGRG
jgi:hypothetical protein